MTGRASTGQITEHTWADQTTVTYGARLSAYGERYREVFGTNTQGWNRTRSEIKLEEILQQIDRGTWVPPTKKATTKQTAPAIRDGHQSFGPFARQIVQAKKNRGLEPKTVEDLDWRLTYLEAELGRLQLLEIDVARVDALRDALTARSQVIREAVARGKPLMETVRQPGKRAYTRPKRTLSNSSINKILALLNQIMQRALEYGYVERNPLRVGEHRDRFLPVAKPRRSWLEVDELHALLDAAAQLDASKRLDERMGRRAALATLSLAGLRVSELCNLRCAHVDLARARFKLADAKTPKGIREVEMTVYNHNELTLYVEQRTLDGLPMRPTDYFFGTTNGTRRDPHDFRRSALQRSLKLANATRAKQGAAPLPQITPHSLRRTWSMQAAQAGRDPHWISDQIGHTSAGFTIEVYQQTRHRRLDERERQAIWELMRFADEPAKCPYVRR